MVARSSYSEMVGRTETDGGDLCDSLGRFVSKLDLEKFSTNKRLKWGRSE